MNEETPLIADYDQHWPAEFAELARKLRTRLSGLALRIDHIGSTAVPGLAAKPILGVQISVTNLEPVDAYREQIESCGFTCRSASPERTKRYFRELPGQSRTHVHVRRVGTFSEQSFPPLPRLPAGPPEASGGVCGGEASPRSVV